jgi:hypothetical protein
VLLLGGFAATIAVFCLLLVASRPTPAPARVPDHDDDHDHDD